MKTLRESLNLAYSFGGCKFKDGTLKYKGKVYDASTAHAAVESVGELNSRFTVTRFLLTGPFALALKKKKDNRDLFLTVEGADYEFVVEVDPKLQKQARDMAAAINTYAKSAAASEEAQQAPVAAPVASAPDVATQLATLAQLHATGAQSADEFAAAKAGLLTN